MAVGRPKVDISAALLELASRPLVRRFCIACICAAVLPSCSSRGQDRSRLLATTPAARPSVASPLSPTSGVLPGGASAAPAAVAAGPAHATSSPAERAHDADRDAESRAAAADFGNAARELYRAASCGASGEVPANLDRALVDGHCSALRFIFDQYRQRWLSKAIPFMAELRPSGLPPRVVYPFGGGDLFAALTVFPDAEEITTISLEPAGDVRSIARVEPPRLRGALAMNRHNLKKLLGLTYSKTTNLDTEGRGALPGEIVFLMAALAVHGLEPVSLKYFAIQEDGSLRFFTEEDFRALDKTTSRSPGQAPPPQFSNVEIAFKKIGSDGPVHVIRHVSQDLSDKALESNPGLILYLSAKGPVSAMTKAASHLLWADEFSIIRNYLLKNVVWMISDSTGIPPRFATAAGFVQDTFGKFDGPARYGPIEPWDARDFRKLFAENPKRDLGFQFGYADVHRQIHLVVTRRTGAT